MILAYFKPHGALLHQAEPVFLLHCRQALVTAPSAAEACAALVVSHAGRRVEASALQLVPTGFGYLRGVIALDAATPLAVLLQCWNLRKVGCESC